MSTLAPVVRRPKSNKRANEFHSEQIPTQQRSSIEMPPIDQHIEREGEQIVPVVDFKKEYADMLAFMEEPVKIIIHRAGGKNPAPTTDLISVNGIKAELLFKNGWIQIGYLPRGQAIVTKRKYLEQIARAKVDSYMTRIEDEEKDPRNFLDPNTACTISFSVLNDPNPARGQEWLEKMLYERI